MAKPSDNKGKWNMAKSQMDAVEAYEASLPTAVPATEEKVDFSYWWVLRKDAIKQLDHLAEILKADAKGRGLAELEPLERWDWAARKFGLNY